jgi:hypothetical protein
MKSPDFSKDVVGGIEALRSKIVTASGRRLFKIVKTDNNAKVLSAVQKHKFKMDGQGNPSGQPDDEMGIADICDALRYIAQNLFPIKGPFKIKSVQSGAENSPSQNPTANEQMRNEISRRIVAGDAPIEGATKKKNGFYWNF